MDGSEADLLSPAPFRLTKKGWLEAAGWHPLPAIEQGCFHWLRLLFTTSGYFFVLFCTVFNFLQLVACELHFIHFLWLGGDHVTEGVSGIVTTNTSFVSIYL
jgi:hypothetical protein